MCGSVEAHWTDRGRCSHCGSIKPEAFMAALERTIIAEDPTYIDKTTKVYKWYVCGQADGELRKFYDWHVPNDPEWKAKANGLMPHVLTFSETKINRWVDQRMAEMTGGKEKKPDA